jgi:hypothetical protein
LNQMSEDLPSASEVGMDHPVLKLQKQNLALKRVIKEIWWMAQRYADKRSSAMPKFYNRAIDLALKNGVEINDPDLYALDCESNKWIPECQCFEGDSFDILQEAGEIK